jgi:sporulation protein YlmC with PRC-barrel domain
MSYEEKDDYGMYRNKHGKGPGPELMGANTLLGGHVHNLQNEHLGVIKEFMVDMRTGAIAYAVMSSSHFVGLGEKLFVVPWQALSLDLRHKRFTMDIARERIANAPGFDTDHWPDMADQQWVGEVHAHYGTRQA